MIRRQARDNAARLMKILYHHRTASKDGQAVHIEEMIHALRTLGHEVRVVSPSSGGEGDSGGEGQMGGRLRWIKRLKDWMPRALYELMELAYTVVAYRKLRAVTRDWQPDFIYERYNLFLLAGVLLRRRLRVPLLLEVNAPLVFERFTHSGGLSLPRLATWAEGKAWSSADGVLAVTAVLAEHVQAYGVPHDRIHVIPNGINREHFAHSPTQEEAKAALGLQGRLVLGFTGFVRDWHGVDRIIRWMAGASNIPNLHLLVVGDGPVRQELKTLAQSLGLRERVTFTGVVHRDKVPAHVAAFDVALQPAVVPYASPLKLMEYLVMGKAVLAPRAANLQEVLTDGVNALMFDECVPGSLEQALLRICTEASLRAHLSQGAIDTIDRLNLTWIGNAQRVVTLGQRLATCLR